MSELKKFRAWDGLNKKMSFWTMNDLCTWDEKSEKPSPLDEWMQFTGLKDKNGVEIYEGDIVRIYLKTINKDMVGEIRWNNTLACFELSVDGGFWGESDWIKVSDKDREVIGNIYENPELLTKGKN